ncbi:MAG: VCBS repeat-containing protein [Chitinophagaceae bacterium]|nr:VCBS repeat-containing protein [Chitinophagaceae bacterium]
MPIPPHHSPHITIRLFIWVVLGGWLLCGCSQSTGSIDRKLFSLIPPEESGINFINKLIHDEEFNIYTYRNFYNGGGVAIGDINNDGLTDIFFTANMQPNRLYLNQGNFRFKDITSSSGIIKKSKWSTGVSMADVNGDGLLDIYVCNSGDVKGDNKKNELYINDGNLHFSEEAEAYGIADQGYSTHASFFDFDRDGDLDMFLLNNSFKLIGSFNLQYNERNTRDSLGGHKLFRNDGNHFVDISEAAGIYGSAIGFGLGVTVGDIDSDGWPDIYVSNDFFERDYLYINSHNGSFTESLEKQMTSISYASMGADMADINNDGHADIFVTEMLPQDEVRLKTNANFENWDKYQLNLKQGYHHQFSRNMLHLNNGDHSFAEIGRMASVDATDWSWGALITDLDNDGWKDIFISNGIYQDLTNGDYIRYISDRKVMNDILTSKNRNKKLIDAMTSNPISNYAFSNNRDSSFTNRSKEWGLDNPGFSNGASYGDLDNDGDLDLVVNNVNMPSFVYRNNSSASYPDHKYLAVELNGTGHNRFAIGAKVIVFFNGQMVCQEQMPSRGFQSSMDYRLNFGLGKCTLIDSVVVNWPDGMRSVNYKIHPDQFIVLEHSKALRPLSPSLKIKNTLFKPALNINGMDFSHIENRYIDFDREKLIFHMMSTSGPPMAKADLNSDGLEDLFIGGAKDQASALYLQRPNGRFIRTNEALLEKDKESEDTDCLFFDADKDGDQDLYVCSGGSEFSPNSTALVDRLYVNDGRGNFKKSRQMLPAGGFESSSCVTAADFDEDGDMDLFVGIRLQLLAYGYPSKGYILENDGTGYFKNVTQQLCPALQSTGMITDAEWLDYDLDNKPDLVLAGEYMPVTILHNENGRFVNRTREAGLHNSNGWWNRVAVKDINNDGYPDIVAGNHGLNSRFKAKQNKPVTLYAADFNNNRKIEQVLSCYNGDQPFPMSLQHDLFSVLPYLKKKFLKYNDYSGKTIQQVFGQDVLDRSHRNDVYLLETSVILNGQHGKFSLYPLPKAAQLSPVYGILVDDFDKDGCQDLLLGGNFFESKPEVGIYDASDGLLLKGNGQGNFLPVARTESGIVIKGAVRSIIQLNINRKEHIVVGRNNDKILFFEKSIH